MTAASSYPLLTNLLAAKILATERATYDPPVGLSFDQKCDLVAEGNRLWEMADYAGLTGAVRQRISLVGQALLAVA
jgi:hypothetical protein